jgi:hypothetical protein
MTDRPYTWILHYKDQMIRSEWDDGMSNLDILISYSSHSRTGCPIVECFMTTKKQKVTLGCRFE